MEHAGILTSKTSLQYGHYFNGKIFDVDLTGAYGKRCIQITRAGQLWPVTFWDFH